MKITAWRGFETETEAGVRYFPGDLSDHLPDDLAARLNGAKESERTVEEIFEELVSAEPVLREHFFAGDSTDGASIRFWEDAWALVAGREIVAVSDDRDELNDLQDALALE